ncbi:hypothetical protein QEH59_11695 [Coraliomargarita sp. SDUM461004]|uniref:Uncharacterized protein n=1 Tax=Thalassobacterium sedimentorum TaxID=3041258 RepID=A0ABU1AJU4_9BACT|nr:hypothetical protein [Coraliomargarita sp. SDUM461004]MDQ8195092.1 hypothetical protein [Coraliomargarita sp. SDUM461004]
MTSERMKCSEQFDWNKRDEIWFIVGVNENSLGWDILFSLTPVRRTREEMDALFLNRRQVEEAHGFPIRWDDFEKTFSYELHHIEAPNEILEPLLAFSRDESSLRSICSIKDEITQRLGVRFRYFYDQCLPIFYYGKTMSIEDIFFRDIFLAKIDWCVCDPFKFAAWVLSDRRWAVMTTVHAI